MIANSRSKEAILSFGIGSYLNYILRRIIILIAYLEKITTEIQFSGLILFGGV